VAVLACELEPVLPQPASNPTTAMKMKNELNLFMPQTTPHREKLKMESFCVLCVLCG
jgi:hypothetical protein